MKQLIVMDQLWHLVRWGGILTVRAHRSRSTRPTATLRTQQLRLLSWGGSWGHPYHPSAQESVSKADGYPEDAAVLVKFGGELGETLTI
jgi:hypothetical protein